MRIHENFKGGQVCSTSGPGAICALDHQYFCRLCGTGFVTNESTFTAGRPAPFYPYCKEKCLVDAVLWGDPLAVRLSKILESEGKEEKDA